MPLTISGSLADPVAFGAIVQRDGRRATSTHLRQAGTLASALAINYSSVLGPSRSGNRRRDKGVSYRNGWDPVLYTGIGDFESGFMELTIRNRSRHARVLEVGAAAHSITPRNKTWLAWPEPPSSAGTPTVFAKHVDHPGFAGFHIMERAARDAMSQSFVGSIGHGQINTRVIH
jgi:hypothetical protein